MNNTENLRITDITSDIVWKKIPARSQDSHKGTFGKVLCVAGSSRFRGAAALCAEGALRSGCGIVTLATVEPVFSSVQSRMPECILMACEQAEMPGIPGSKSAASTARDIETEYFGGISASEAPRLRAELDKDYDALVVGPGMGNTEDTRQLVKTLAESSRAAVVLDADALNSLSIGKASAKENNTALPASEALRNITMLPLPAEGGSMIITPHPGEMARLCGCSISEIKACREYAALIYAVMNKCVVVLKEHRTLIATPDGRLYRNTTGNSGLARGGSGDILAGMIASLAAQGLGAEDAAICGVWLHGKAAELCSDRKSQTTMLPHDIFDDLGLLMRIHNR